MKIDRYCIGIMELLAFSITLLLAFTSLESEYLFGWVSHNWTMYLLLCAVPIVLLIGRRPFMSACMSAAIILGLFIGNYLGAMLRAYNIKQITDEMNAEEVARHYRNNGFSIWMAIVLVGFILGIGFEVRYQRQRNNQKIEKR